MDRDRRLLEIELDEVLDMLTNCIGVPKDYIKKTVAGVAEIRLRGESNEN